MNRIRDFYGLAKPGIIYGNLITVIGGFTLGWRVAGTGSGFAATIIGISLVVGSAAVFNNYIDRDIDREMVRTKNRPLTTGRVSGRAAITYGIILGVPGFFLLGWDVNLITAAVAALGFFFYVFAYSMWSKRQAPFGTVIGSISGAVPPVVGYAAASGRIDAAAAILFIILALWQMPHFLAIGIYRRDEYAAAGISIMPVAEGVRPTKVAMLFYTIAFIGAVFALATTGAMGSGLDRAGYLIVSGIISLMWLGYCLYGFRIHEPDRERRWGRRMFFLSLAVLVTLFLAITFISMDALLAR